jgi:hypothetical protein
MIQSNSSAAHKAKSMIKTPSNASVMMRSTLRDLKKKSHSLVLDAQLTKLSTQVIQPNVSVQLVKDSMVPSKDVSVLVIMRSNHPSQDHSLALHAHSEPELMLMIPLNVTVHQVRSMISRKNHAFVPEPT